MAVYTPHRESVVQTIFRKSRANYEGCADPPVDTLARVDEFLVCSDWSGGVARVKCAARDQKRTIPYAEYLAEDL